MFKLLITAVIISLSSQTFSASLEEKLEARRSKSQAKRPENIKAVFSKQSKDLERSQILKKALKEGVDAPSFNLNDKHISSFYKQGNVVVKFYRGGWCPYCMIELKEYQGYYSKFKERGCEIIALSPDLKIEIRKTKKKFDLEFPMYSDQENKIAKKFGLAFALNKDILSIYKKFGIDLKKSQGNERNELPLPGTYVINKKGKIVYAYVNLDYTRRAEPSEVLKHCNN